MWGTVKIVVVILLLVLAAMVGLMFWVLCRAAKEEFKGDPHPPSRKTGKAIEGPCERCVRYDECQAVDEGCLEARR